MGGRMSPSSDNGGPMAREKVICKDCGTEMTHHADKLDYAAAIREPDAVDPALGGVLEEVHTCPECGEIEIRRGG